MVEIFIKYHRFVFSRADCRIAEFRTSQSAPGSVSRTWRSAQDFETKVSEIETSDRWRHQAEMKIIKLMVLQDNGKSSQQWVIFTKRCNGGWKMKNIWKWWKKKDTVLAKISKNSRCREAVIPTRIVTWHWEVSKHGIQLQRSYFHKAELCSQTSK